MNQCIKRIRGQGRFGSFNPYQCSRMAIEGTQWCKQHTPEIAAQRQRERNEKCEAEWEAKRAVRVREAGILKACEGLTVEEVRKMVEERVR